MYVSKYPMNPAWRPIEKAFRKSLRKVFALGVAIALLCFPIAGIGYIDEGGIDKSFGTDGIVTTNKNGLVSGQAMRIQKDDKIVVGGYHRAAISGLTNFAMARYNTDGALDTDFGNKGTVTTESLGQSLANALAIQSDGKILLGGWSQRGIDTIVDFDFALARYNSDGTLDQSFGDGGKTTTDFSGVDVAQAMAIQSDGKIVLAGRALGSGQGFDFAVARYNLNGSLDMTFGAGGKVQTDFNAQDDRANAISIQRDGKIVVAGAASQKTFALVRYDRNGGLDQAFGDHGKVSTAFEGQTAEAAGLVLLNFDETILVAGTAGTQTDRSFALVEYKSDGTLDTSFGENGRVVTGFPGTVWDMRIGAYAYSIAVQKNRKIVVGGFVQPIPPPMLPVYFPRDIALVRYNSNGTLDAGFGSGGKLSSDFQGGDEGASAIAIQPDGNILVAGTRNYNAFAVARYLGDPVPVPTIVSVSVKKKDLIISGENFDPNARVYVNGQQQLVTTKGNPPRKLIALRASRLVASGETAIVVVENSDGTLSKEFLFSRSE